MEKNLLQKAESAKHKRKDKHIRQLITGLLAAVTLFSTSYSLMLPAVTLDGSPHCGFEEHAHDENCYETMAVQEVLQWSCGISEETHRNDGACMEGLPEEAQLVCDNAEESHQHEIACYRLLREVQQLTCQQQEHIHEASCFAQEALEPKPLDPAPQEAISEVSDLQTTEELEDEEKEKSEELEDTENVENQENQEEQIYGEEKINEEEQVKLEEQKEQEETEVFMLRGGSWASGSAFRDISFSKSAEDTAVENLFDIHLNLTLPNENAPTIVCVMDVSSSMKDQCAVCGVNRDPHEKSQPMTVSTYFGKRVSYEPCDQFTERLEIAKSAAENFFLKLNSNRDFENCYVKVIAFDSGIKLNSGWYDVAQSDGLQGALSTVRGLQSIQGSRTNISIGVKTAYEEIMARNGGNRTDSSFLVLLSDGAPNRSSSLDAEATSDATVNAWRSRWQQYSNYDYDYADSVDKSIYMGAPYYAQKLQSAGARVYSVVLGESLDNGGKSSNWRYIPGIGIDNDEYLASFSNYSYKATSSTSLNAFYTDIFNSISCKVSDLSVTDPMSEHVDFLYFVNAQGEPTEPPTGADYDSKTRTITWTPSVGSKQYALHYRVHLKNELPGFLSAQTYPTNGVTFAEYDLTTGGSTTHRRKEAAIPRVMGYLGTLDFQKVNPAGVGLANAKFLLTHDADGCPCQSYGPVPIGARTAISQEDGSVQFFDIPSGHRYRLQETEAPEGYRLSNETHCVCVSYGVLTINGADGWDGSFVNEPAVYSLTISKTLDAPDPSGIFHFTAEMDTGPFPQPPSDSEGYWVDENGLAQFDLADGGAVTLQGIPGGTVVTVTETNADGYILLVKPDDGVAYSAGSSWTVTVEADCSVAVVNTAGYELPEAGGIGVILVYTLGAALLIGTCMCKYKFWIIG